MQRHVIMIDNYDSFTWNLYEYLCQEGARVDVFRNDKITIAEIEALHPDLLLISPGPGHPKTDSGISRDCISHFAGKIPVFGVCMGQQCMFEVFGGNVEFAGEIVHGKTSPIHHDNKGFFAGVPQGVAVTRYHSLAGTKASLPDCLEVTATTDNGIIMGVRHTKYTVEGVQFHPESILTEEGHLMMRNILKVSGGTWAENDAKKVADVTAGGSILDKIYAQRKKDIAEQEKIPGFSFDDLAKNYELGLAPPALDLYERLKNEVSLIAEVKRASPSKGNIDINANAAEQALKYASNGAAGISVLTEPHWFKGSLQDLVNVRKVVEKLPNRPAVLRKEFIFSKYQILEARLAGADTVLLIVKMLTDKELQELYTYSKSLGMEPLVEVTSPQELASAAKVGAKVIGVNNRDLHSFTVDLNTTSSLVDKKPNDALLIALSGITSQEDSKKYKSEGINGFLIGEALMRAADVGQFIKDIIA